MTTEGCCASEQEATRASVACIWQLDLVLYYSKKKKNASTSLGSAETPTLKGSVDSAPSHRKATTLRHRVPVHKHADFKKILSWSRRFKKEEEILETISFVMLNAAKKKKKNKIWVKASYLMTALPVAGCFYMVTEGKKAAKTHESLASLYLERNTYLRKEAAMKAQTEKKYFCWIWKTWE